jgi:hypothetical protein
MDPEPVEPVAIGGIAAEQPARLGLVQLSRGPSQGFGETTRVAKRTWNGRIGMVFG